MLPHIVLESFAASVIGLKLLFSKWNELDKYPAKSPYLNILIDSLGKEGKILEAQNMLATMIKEGKPLGVS